MILVTSLITWCLELDAGEIVASLNKVYLLLEEINRVILKMFEKCDPTIFYHKRTYNSFLG
jgi:hypothetical protein